MQKVQPDWETFSAIIRLGDCELSRSMFETYTNIIFRSGSISEIIDIQESRIKESENHESE